MGLMGLQLISSYLALVAYAGAEEAMTAVEVGLVVNGCVVWLPGVEQATINWDNCSGVNLRYRERFEVGSSSSLSSVMR
jgi:hypothetical protein